MAKSKSLTVQQNVISLTRFRGEDYICLTDMAKSTTDDRRAADVIKNWIRTLTTLEFFGSMGENLQPRFQCGRI